MERSVLRERTTFEDERNKMLMEMKQEREALQKSKVLIRKQQICLIAKSTTCTSILDENIIQLNCSSEDTQSITIPVPL